MYEEYLRPKDPKTSRDLNVKMAESYGHDLGEVCVVPVPCGAVMEDLGARSVDPAVFLPGAASAVQSYCICTAWRDANLAVAGLTGRGGARRGESDLGRVTSCKGYIVESYHREYRRVYNIYDHTEVQSEVSR